MLHYIYFAKLPYTLHHPGVRPNQNKLAITPMANNIVAATNNQVH